MATTDFDLTSRLTATDGSIALSGVQALLRVPVDQHRADAARGVDIATLVCGYRGSPLGGVEGVIARHQEALDRANVRFISGVNEDLAATAIWGSQMTALEDACTYDGVLGLWYGKGPGVDRSGDAFRHAMFAGVGPNGGVLALAGDDPECKSSTIPSASEASLADVGMPVLYPADVGDCLRLGRYGIELSRTSGLWVGVKVHTDVADGFATVPASAGDIELVRYVHEVDGAPWTPTVDNRLLVPHSLMLEEELFGERMEAAKGFVRENAMDRSWGATDAWLGIVVAGKPIGDVREALAELGVDEESLAELGIRVYAPAMISPLEPQGVRAFASGLETIFVVEAKRPFIEAQVRDILYGGPDTPEVVGKRWTDRSSLLPSSGVISASGLAGPLRRVLESRIDPSRLARRRERIPLLSDSAGLPARTPYYCSGCPHNRSTTVPDGSVALGGIGCHSMALWMDRSTEGLTQMGGEGAQWVGAAPFVGNEHRFQNLGDGTLFHSGSLAIRQAVSAGTNLTFKILYNGVVAMTGGQEAAGEMPVPELTRMLEAEGVVRTVVVTDDPSKYPGKVRWADNSRVVDRDLLDDVQRELRDIPGVTALVYDQGCAADLRRTRKRGTVETPTTRIMIDEAICEGCGHCGEISNCMSVHPVDTPFGRKTRIHQESCNFDYTCVDGNCPAFVSVEIDLDEAAALGRQASAAETWASGEPPLEPDRPGEASVLVVGIGGTGVVTVSQVLSTAAMLDGIGATSLDQTGLAQKGGQVVANLHLGGSHDGAAKIGTGGTDTALIFDVLGGSAPAILDRFHPEKTVAVVSTSRVPTGEMVSRTDRADFPATDRFRTVIDGHTSADDNAWIDAERIARYVFASQPAANMLVLGLAYQRGRIPVSSGAIDQAIAANGVAVTMNQQAFALGRALAADAELLNRLDHESRVAAPEPPAPTSLVRSCLDRIDTDEAPELLEALLWRLPVLVAWGGAAWANQYADDIAAVRRAELGATDSRHDFSTVAARQLAKLMTYKDEYEVARLALESDLAQHARERFGPSAALSYKLKPPTLKNAGYDKKIAIPEAAGRTMFRSLRKSVRLRGTRLDPFGRTEERQIERELIDHYRELLGDLAAGLTERTYQDAVEIAGLADRIRGFDTIKLQNVEAYRRELADRLASRD